MTAKPIDAQTAAPDTFISSKEPANNRYGQNGSTQAASLCAGETKPNIPKVSPKSAALPADRGLGAQDSVSFVTKGGAPVPVHHGVRNRNDEHSGTVPAKPTRR